jgi:hypothetical protein
MAAGQYFVGALPMNHYLWNYTVEDFDRNLLIFTKTGNLGGQLFGGVQGVLGKKTVHKRRNTLCTPFLTVHLPLGTSNTDS